MLTITMLMSSALPARADDFSDGQWYASALRLSQAQQLSKGADVIVAVIDSGVDASHPDLSGSVLSGADFSTSSSTSSGDGRRDAIGHGTGMASLIAGHSKTHGVAPAAKILPVRVGTAEGDSIATGAGIRWAVDHGARVISISLGNSAPDPRERVAVEYALAHDVVIIAAAGNKPEASTVQYPAKFEGVIAVCATDSKGSLSSHSVTGPEVALCAPGEKVSHAGAKHGYFLGTGTSDATAIVAGVAALLRAKDPQLSAADVIHRLTVTATDRGAAGRDAVYGYGIVNPVDALSATSGASATAPSTAVPTATSFTEPASQSSPGLTLIRLAFLGCLLMVVIVVVIGVVLAIRRISRS
ncbi:S8 family serine peptidase [Hamadaea sp. NPDC051192]|uniref:S8 family serine peptidase n=1 Tax=Hamadaea sp. NPDC051192 TaxID=3154940 RepID=UPI00341FA095